MNRVATWILGTISGLMLAFGALAFTLAGVGGYGISSGCVSSDGQASCTPVVQQATVPLPSLSGPAPFAFTLLALAFLIGLPAWIATPILAARRGSSARTAILVVSVIATALLIVGVVVIPLTSPVFSAPEVCLNGAGSGSQTCFTGTQAFWVALAAIIWGPASMALIAGAPAWVMTLTQTARWRQWGWFVAALLFSPVAALLYAFFGASRLPAAAAPISPAAPTEPAPAV